MKGNYSHVHFHVELPEIQLPSSFSILTAYNPVGKLMSNDENVVAHEALENELNQLPVPLFDVTLSFDDMKSYEPGFASEARLHTLFDLAQRYDQYALYSIDGDNLSVVNCKDAEMQLIPGGFRARVLEFNKKTYT